MIRQVITKIDCGDWCCNACKWISHDILTNTDTCQLFNEQVFDSPTFSSQGHKERCDACKQAEARAIQPLYIQREEARHQAHYDAALGEVWNPPTLEQLKERHNELVKKLGVKDKEMKNEQK